MGRTSILAVTSEMPWPLNSGGHLRTFHLLRSLAEGFDVRLVMPSTASSPDGEAALRGAGIRPAVVTVPRRTAVRESVRVAAAALRSEPYVLFARHRRRAVRQLLRLEAARRPPDLLYLDHLDSLVYADVVPSARVVIDMHNVYSHLARRTAAESHGLRRRYLTSQARLLESRERRAACAADGLMAVSREDARHFSRLGAPRVAVVPNGVDCSAYHRAQVRTHATPTVLYVGALDWRPNVSAACFLARKVLPALRQLVPDVGLLLVGRNPVPEVMALAAADAAVEIASNVPDVVPYFARADVLAVPLEAGGGTRLKILEAFAAGVPVVSTRIGCEGIDADNDEHLLVCERPDFPAALARVLLNPGEAGARAARARALAEREYDWKAVGERAADMVSRVTRK